MSARTLILTLLACISLWGCKKEKSTSFEVTGLEDITIRYTETRAIPVSIVYNGGDKQAVSLSVDGLPSGAIVSFVPVSKTIPFETQMNLSTKDVKGGVYNLVITAKPEEGAPHTYNVKMKVNDVEEIGCAMEIAADYTSVATVHHNLNMANAYLRPATEKNRVTFINCVPYGFFADLDCNNDKLIIPRQKISTGFVSGNGVFTGLLVVLSIQLEDSLGTIIRRQDVTLERKVIIR